MKKIILFLLICTIFITGCGKKELLTYTYIDYEEGNRVEKTINYYETKKTTNYVLIDTSNGKIIAKLLPEVAPITVKNFQYLVKTKFYNDLIFHRVIKDFMIQTGDPTGTGTSESSNTIKGEFTLNGVNNNLSHERGVLSMARQDKDYNSASSQFFIVQRDSTYLNGSYAAFGYVIAGMEVVDKIASVQTNSNDKPLTTQKLNSITFIEIVK